jgi:hypothetical protein
VPAQLDLATIGFWTLEQPMAAVDLSLNTLRIGTLDGRVTRTVELHNPGMGPVGLPLQPQPVGPAGGQVLYVADDGHVATLHAVSVASGADVSLGSTPAFIAALAIDPTGSTAYSVGLDRRTGGFLELDAIATGGGRPRSVIRVEDLGPDAGAPYSPEPGVSYYPRLAVSADGRWVALASCRPSGCDLVAAPTEGGPLAHWSGYAFDDQIVGIAGDLLIGSRSCAEPWCDGFVIDLRSGDRQPLGGAADTLDPTQLISGPRGPLVLGHGRGDVSGQWQDEVLDLTDRSRSTLATTGQLAGWRQAELPAGWFLTYSQSDGAPSLPPAYSAGNLHGAPEVPLPAMTIPEHDIG